MRRPRRSPEAELHAAVVQYLRLALPRAVVHHSPNEGKRTRWQQGRIKAHGVVAGFPDLAVFVDGKVVLIELKAAAGRVSPAQTETHLRLSVAGFPVHVCRSIEDVADALLDAGFPMVYRVHPADRRQKSEAPPA